MKRKILLTGATGFLGSNILKNLINKNYEIIILKRSTSNVDRICNCDTHFTSIDIDKDQLDEIFETQKIDIILHCATNYGRKNTEPLQILDANLIFPLKLLELAKKRNVFAFINTDTILDPGISHYSLSKKHFKDWLKQYSHDLVCINVALEHFYGPSDDDSKFVTNIIHSLIANVDKIDLTLGEQRRDFIYIDDVVDSFLTILRNLERFHNGFYEFEIGTKKLITIREFVELTKSIINNHHTQLNFGALPYRPNEIMESLVNLTEILKLGWKSKIALVDGLKRTIEYEKNNQK